MNKTNRNAILTGVGVLVVMGAYQMYHSHQSANQYASEVIPYVNRLGQNMNSFDTYRKENIANQMSTPELYLKLQSLSNDLASIANGLQNIQASPSFSPSYLSTWNALLLLLWTT